MTVPPLGGGWTRGGGGGKVVSDHKTVVRKISKSDGQTGSRCLAIEQWKVQQ